MNNTNIDPVVDKRNQEKANEIILLAKKMIVDDSQLSKLFLQVVEIKGTMGSHRNPLAEWWVCDVNGVGILQLTTKAYWGYDVSYPHQKIDADRSIYKWVHENGPTPDFKKIILEIISSEEYRGKIARSWGTSNKFHQFNEMVG